MARTQPILTTAFDNLYGGDSSVCFFGQKAEEFARFGPGRDGHLLVNCALNRSECVSNSITESQNNNRRNNEMKPNAIGEVYTYIPTSANDHFQRHVVGSGGDCITLRTSF